VLLAVVVLSGLVVAATAEGRTTAASGPVVEVAFNKKLKKTILVDKSGRTLYMFTEDTGGLITVCTVKGPYGVQCPTIWPPLLAKGPASAGTGVKASLLGIGKRADGKRQVTYNHHPLYYFHGVSGPDGDKKPGDVNGQGFVNEWFVLSPKGVPIRTH
jgi:predicted lipoprotein with Yx(FWY)xxD motif